MNEEQQREEAQRAWNMSEACLESVDRLFLERCERERKEANRKQTQEIIGNLLRFIIWIIFCIGAFHVGDWIIGELHIYKEDTIEMIYGALAFFVCVGGIWALKKP